MKSQLKIYNDKAEQLSFKLMLEGINANETDSRLCLEFSSGENIYFKGKIDMSGNCNIVIPAMKDMVGEGNAYIEIISDKNYGYFKVYETNFVIEKKVNIQLENLNIDEDKSEMNISITEPIFKRENVLEEKSFSFKPFIPNKK